MSDLLSIIEKEEEKSITQASPLYSFMYALKSSEARRQYPKRLKMLFDFLNLHGSLEEQATEFLDKAKQNIQWSQDSIMRFLDFHKERVRRKELAARTLKNYYRAAKLFCEMNDLTLNWKRILYCFSVIDLLGALYAGHARSSKTVDNSKKYMNDLMKYDKNQINILQKMFRHKMVHLAQPKPIMKDPTQNENIAWQHNEDPRSKHLIIEKTSQPREFTIWKSNKITYENGFIISINKFKEDIKSSVQKPVNGYLLRLESEALLKDNFKIAINQIFDPQIID